jgi:haloacetate dehalogenase
MDQFSHQYITTSETKIFIRKGGSGPPLLLLHGFPETHHMWRSLAPLLATDFTVVLADLRGYGKSGCPLSTDDHLPYSKRAMAKDMVEVMEQLGFSNFVVIGHDRGGRVAYRLALDYPEVATKLVVLDIIPTDTAWEKADARMMLGFWPWSIFAQPPPLPERILETSANVVVNNACDNWGSSPGTFSAKTRDIYIQALKDPQHIHAICEEYRAAATIDRSHDAADFRTHRVIGCPVAVFWGSGGALDSWYAGSGGPLAIWRTIASNIQGQSLQGGHFFPEEAPEELYQKLNQFL